MWFKQTMAQANAIRVLIYKAVLHFPEEVFASVLVVAMLAASVVEYFEGSGPVSRNVTAWVLLAALFLYQVRELLGAESNFSVLGRIVLMTFNVTGAVVLAYGGDTTEVFRQTAILLCLFFGMALIIEALLSPLEPVDTDVSELTHTEICLRAVWATVFLAVMLPLLYFPEIVAEGLMHLMMH